MFSLRNRSIAAKIPPSIFIALVCMGVILLLEAILSSIQVAEPFLENLDNFNSTIVTVAMEMDKMLISFALIVIGISSSFIIGTSQEGVRFMLTDIQYKFRVLIVISILSAIVSIYCGYVIYMEIIEMLSNRMFNFTSLLVAIPQRVQFLSFLVSLIALICFISLNFGNARKDQQ